MTALNEIERSRKEHNEGQRGPENESRRHFKGPVPVVDAKKKLRWEFQCKYCGKTRSCPRTQTGPNPEFDKEKPRPRINNLPGHLSECAEKVKFDEKVTRGEEVVLEGASTDAWKLRESVKLMDGWLKLGELNPSIVPTYRGFLRIFAAWILDESLPWTTGEAPTLQALFKYLKVTYQLPSDTTVRNQLAHIFKELHEKVVLELSVSTRFYSKRQSMTYRTLRTSNQESPTRPTPGPQSRWSSHLRAQWPSLSMMTGT